ncbi:MAG: efflux RND transporter permease subunit, partial [Psychrosphaera sp.]|nr:efflux RND transporter permease subunit [Psychrosphaera sp.]
MQLFPDIDKPKLVIQTAWSGASPKEIESEINQPIEKVLRGIPGLTRMMAVAPPNMSFINLTFDSQTNMDKVLLEIIGRLNRLPPLPADAEPPIIVQGGWDNASEALIEYFVQLQPDAEGSISDHRKFVEKVVLPQMQALYGVASISLTDSTTSGPQLQINIDPYKAADLGIDITQLAGKIGKPNDVSGGFVDIGRRLYTLRFRGKFEPAELGQLVLDWRGDSPVRLGDIAQITVAKGPKEGFIFQNGNPAMRIGITKANGANVLRSLDGLKSLVEDLNEGALKYRGLVMRDSFDPSVFILRSIQLLTSNFTLGIVFSLLSLWFFLRRIKPTLLIGLAIPVSLLATFVVLQLAGRSLNVISLAGLAFATGMVLDAAIVVLENIFRLKQRGKSADEA